MKKVKIKKSIWLTAALAFYAGAISWYFGPRLIAEGQSTKFWISVAVEIVFITGLFFALRHKEHLASHRPY